MHNTGLEYTEIIRQAKTFTIFDNKLFHAGLKVGDKKYFDI